MHHDFRYCKFHRANKVSFDYARGDRLSTSESDVCRRQILTWKDGPHTEELKYFRRPITYVFK